MIRYILEYNGITEEVYTTANTPFSWSKVDNGNFLRRTTEAKLRFGAIKPVTHTTSAPLLLQIEDSTSRCDDIYIHYEKKCPEGWYRFGSDKFTMNDGEFDRDRCEVDIKSVPSDKYQCILDNDREINILDVPNEVSFSLSNVPNYEYLICSPCNINNLPCNGESTNQGWRLLSSECGPIQEGTGILKTIFNQTGSDLVTDRLSIDGNQVAYWHTQREVIELYDCETDSITDVFPLTVQPRKINVSNGYVSFDLGIGDSKYSYDIINDDLKEIQSTGNVDAINFTNSGQYTIFHDKTSDQVVVYNHDTNTSTNIDPANSVTGVFANGDFAAYYYFNPGPNALKVYQFSTGILTSIYVDDQVDEISLTNSSLFWRDTNVGGGNYSIFHYNLTSGITTTIVTSGSPTIVGTHENTLVYYDGSDLFLWVEGSTPVNISNNGAGESTTTYNYSCGNLYYNQYNTFVNTNTHTIYNVANSTSEQFLVVPGGLNPFDHTRVLESSILYQEGAILYEYVYGSGVIKTVLTSSDILSVNITSDCNNATFYNRSTDDLYFYIGGVNNLTPYQLWYREVVTVPCVAGEPTLPSGTGWVEYSNDCVGLNTVTYVRPPSQSYPITTTDCAGGTPATPSIFGNWQLIRCENDVAYWIDLGDKLIYDRNRDLGEVLLFMIQSICPDIECVVSDYFQWNPENSSPDNYISGTANQFNKILIAQKSDIKRPNSSEKATKGEISFLEMMEKLKDTFNVDWFIDDDCCLRIEHVNYGRNVNSKDLRALIQDENYPDTYRNKYKYDTDRLNKVDTFKFQEAKNPDFVGCPIEYYDMNRVVYPCVGKEKIDHNVDCFTTDIDHVRFDTEDIDDAGFVLIATEDDGAGGLKVIVDDGNLTGLPINNAPLSWANLHDPFWKYEASNINGWMNCKFTEFETVKKHKIGEPFTIPFCCDDIKEINEYGAYTTEMGVGKIEKFSYDPRANNIKLELIY